MAAAMAAQQGQFVPASAPPAEATAQAPAPVSVPPFASTARPQPVPMQSQLVPQVAGEGVHKPLPTRSPPLAAPNFAAPGAAQAVPHGAPTADKIGSNVAEVTDSFFVDTA